MKNIQPFIFEKTRDGEILYDVYSRLVKERIIFLSEEIDAEVATSVAATLLFLDSQNSKKPISIYINSPGGSISDGLWTVYDCMLHVSAPIKTVAIGTAYSAASLILAAGTPGMRMAFPHADCMIHSVQVGNLYGSSAEIERETKRIVDLNNRLMECLAFHTKNDLETIKKLCGQDSYFTSEEALKFGLIDQIVQPKKLSLDDRKALAALAGVPKNPTIIPPAPKLPVLKPVVAAPAKRGRKPKA